MKTTETIMSFSHNDSVCKHIAKTPHLKGHLVTGNTSGQD